MVTSAFYCSTTAHPWLVLLVLLRANEQSICVGYAQSGLQNGATMVAPQFLPVDGVALSLDSLSPTGEGTSDSVEIQTLDAAGRTVTAYTWNDWASDKACWVNGDFEPVTGVTFAPGQGLWVSGASTAQGLQSVGKVGSADVLVQLRSGATATGNPFPVSVSLNDIVPEGDGLSDAVEIQTLDAAGRTVDAYTWNDWASSEPCWVNGDFEPVTGVTFAAGQGLWVSGSSTSQYLRFPAPTL